MGALTINRKRRDEFNYYTSDFKLPSSNSVSPNADDQIDLHISKKPRTLSYSSPEQSISSKKAEIRVSRVYKYPEPLNPIRREVHAPCRARKLGFLTGLSRNSRGFGGDMGNKLSFNYDSAKKDVIRSFRYVKKDDEEEIGVDREDYGSGDVSDSKDEGVIDVDATEDDGNGDVSTDLSVEEVGFVGDEEGEGRSVASEQMEFDRKVVECSFQPSSSSVVTDLDGKVDNGSISLEQKLEKLELLGLPMHKKLRESAERRNSKLNSLRFQIELNERRRDTLQLLRPVKRVDDKDVLQAVVRERFLPLTKEEEAEVSRALSNSYRRKVLVTHENSNIEITGELLQCLRPGAWLNDEVINVYLELLKEREKREPKNFLKCHFFNTFFYKKLVSGTNGYDFKSVRRWTTQRKLGYSLHECDKIFVPIHKEIHWCLAVINKKDQKFQYLDSLGGLDTQVLKVLARYFMDEVKDKNGESINVSSWTQEYVEDLPEQKNGWDCGMFMIKYADFYSRGLGLCFNQENMPYFRLRTAKEILRLKAE